jgi:Rrf2 family transcriptional regulator, cysteine metabolism repressor
MKVGTKGFYGLLALTELARTYGNGSRLQVREIAEVHQVSEEYLSQIMLLLKRAKLVYSTRGPTGGYSLARSPTNVTVGEVLRLLEGPGFGVELAQLRARCGASTACRRIVEIWTKGIEALEEVLDGITLAELCRPDEKAMMYYI